MKTRHVTTHSESRTMAKIGPKTLSDIT